MGDALERDAPYSVLAVIRAQLRQLPAGEARVAQVVLDQPYSAMSWSAQELAERAEASSPTVVRACRRLGFSGLPELRLELARELGWMRLDTGSVPEEASGPESVLRSTFASTLQGVQALAEHVDEAAFAEAVAAIDAAKRVLLVCAGPTQVVCRDAVFDLVSIGRHAEFVDDHLTQLMVAGQLGPGDVAVAVGVSGENDLTVQAAKAAKHGGATVVSVTGFAKSTLGRLGDVQLQLAVPSNGEQRHGTATMVGMIILFRAVTAALVGAAGTAGPGPLTELFDEMHRPSGR